MKKFAALKNNRISITIGIIFISVLFVICVMIAVSIFQSVSDEMYAERSNNLNEVTEQIAKTIYNICNSSWNVSDAAFSHILSTEIESKESLAALIKEAENGTNTYKYHLALIDSQTNYYLSSGKAGLFKNIEFLTEKVDERQVVMTTVTFEDDKEHMLFLRRLKEPLILKDGTQITHTVMVLPEEVYTHAFSCSGFNGYADVFIVHSDGQSIYRQDNTGNFSISANIMRILGDVKFLHGGNFDQLMNSLVYPQGKSLEFVYENKNYFVSLAPVEVPNWVVALIIPTKQMNSGFEYLLNATMYRIVTISIIGVLMAVMIIYYFISAVNMRIRATQQKQVNAALQKAAEEANKANKAKSEFLSYISHDFRTPLNGIMGMLERAEECPDISEELQHCLSGISLASNHLYALINDVLDLKSLESGKDMANENPFDLRSVIYDCCSMIQSSANKYNITFTYRCAGFRHPNLIGYDLYLHQVLINVLSNAVKFTKEGGNVTFEASEIAFKGETASFQFIIEDTGVGMKEGYQEHIFEPFWRDNNSVRTSQKSTGLGMSITKMLIDKMGGTIEVYSGINEGSRFTIVLPFSVNQSDLPINKDIIKPQPNALKGMKILLCEDNMLNRDIAEHILKKAGAEIIIACNGEEAVEAFERSEIGSIDAILMDVMMPVMDGLEATRAIRSLNRPDGKSVSIIAMTANAFEEDVKKTLAAGMNEHFSKPINGKLLVSNLLKYKKQNK